MNFRRVRVSADRNGSGVGDGGGLSNADLDWILDAEAKGGYCARCRGRCVKTAHRKWFETALYAVPLGAGVGLGVGFVTLLLRS